MSIRQGDKGAMKGSRDEVAEVKLLSLMVGLATSVDGVEKDGPVEQRRSHWPLPFPPPRAGDTNVERLLMVEREVSMPLLDGYRSCVILSKVCGVNSGMVFSSVLSPQSYFVEVCKPETETRGTPALPVDWAGSVIQL